MTAELRQAVARAIDEAWLQSARSPTEQVERMADAAIAVIREALAEPPEEFRKWYSGGNDTPAREVWHKYVLAAGPLADDSATGEG